MLLRWSRVFALGVTVVPMHFLSSGSLLADSCSDPPPTGTAVPYNHIQISGPTSGALGSAIDDGLGQWNACNEGLDASHQPIHGNTAWPDFPEFLRASGDITVTIGSQTGFQTLSGTSTCEHQ